MSCRVLSKKTKDKSESCNVLQEKHLEKKWVQTSAVNFEKKYCTIHLEKTLRYVAEF